MSFCRHENVQRLAVPNSSNKHRCLDCGVVLSTGTTGKKVYETFDNSYIKGKKAAKLNADRQFWGKK